MFRKSTLQIVLVAAALAGSSVSAAAEDATTPTAEPNEFTRVCDAYGPGYQVVPGTATCIKINGFVRMDVNISGGGSGSSSAPAPSPPN